MIIQLVIKGDLNSEMSEPSIDEFCQTCNSESIVNKPTCLTSPESIIHWPGAD